MTVVAATTVAIPTRVLVFGMAHDDGTLVPAEIHPVAEACGLSGEQVRSCLRRMTSEGLIVRSGSGVDARYDASEAGMAEIGQSIERTRLAYGQDAAGRGWDRQWRLVGFAVPERQRAARDAFRDRLRALGGAPVQSGLFVSPHAWHKDVLAEADRLEMPGALTLATTDDLEMGGVRDPRELARGLWPLEELARRYQRFADAFARLPDVLRDMRAGVAVPRSRLARRSGRRARLQNRTAVARRPAWPPQVRGAAAWV